MNQLAFRRAFTLIELLVVIAIIGLLVAILLPAVQSAREASRRSQCSNSLKQLGIAFQTHHDSQGAFPPGSYVLPAGGQLAYGWGIRLLPYLEQSAAADGVTYSFGNPSGNCCLEMIAMQGAGQPNPAAATFRLFGCPSDFRSYYPYLSGPTGPYSDSYPCGLLTAGSYFGVSGNVTSVTATSCENGGVNNGNGILFNNPISTDYIHGIYIRDITDGLTNTMMLGERGIPIDYSWGWSFCGGTECDQYLATQQAMYMPAFTAPQPQSVDHFWSYHSNGAFFEYADGSVHFLTYNIDINAYQALSTRNGAETVDTSF